MYTETAKASRRPVEIVAPTLRHQSAFLTAVKRSRRLHRPWVHPPSDGQAFRSYLGRFRGERQQGFLVLHRESRELVGVVNVSEIVRGSLLGAYLGFYAFAPHNACGYMRRGLDLVLREAFGRLKLHRLEANIQPGNASSIALVKRLGFEKEGFSRRYLKIGGRWRDHERWAILSDGGSS